jgi:leucine dehydrogenase
MHAPWEFPDFDDHEAVHIFRDSAAGLTAVIAIHSSNLGPAAGGTRFWHYAQDSDAVTDALRLSRGMSYKNAMADLPMGGGKAVIVADAKRTKSPEQIAAFARAIESLGGRYVTAQDVGMTLDDMIQISKTTRFVSGLPPKPGMAGGDPGPSTATGVYLGVKAAVAHKLGQGDMTGVHVAIQGVGSVGGGLARALAADGARLTLADANAEKVKSLAAELGAEVVDADAILGVEADVMSPCALGAILNEQSIARLRTQIVAGGANNQLAVPDDGDRLVARGILYAPDYVINAGGIINVALGYLGSEDSAAVSARIAKIPERLQLIWDQSSASGENPSKAADRMAQGLIGRL